jgi:hypothetical protein
MAYLVVRGRAVGEGPKPPQELQFGSAETHGVDRRLRLRQRQKQHLVERIGDPCLSAGNPASPRNTTEEPSSSSPPQQPRPLPPSIHPPRESEVHGRSSSQAVYHAKFQLIQSIALAIRVIVN